MSSSFEIVLSLDGNENMRNSRIAKTLLELRLCETSQLFSDEEVPVTFHTRQNQLDTV